MNLSEYKNAVNEVCRRFDGEIKAARKAHSAAEAALQKEQVAYDRWVANYQANRTWSPVLGTNGYIAQGYVDAKAARRGLDQAAEAARGTHEKYYALEQNKRSRLAKVEDAFRLACLARAEVEARAAVDKMLITY